MLHSYKARMVALFALLSGLVLCLFAFFAMSVLYRVGLERMDRELQVLGAVNLRRPQPLEHWGRFYQSLGTLYGAKGQEQFMIKVTDPQGARIYASPSWPQALTGAAFGLPDHAAEAPPTPRPPAWHAQRRYPPPDEPYDLVEPGPPLMEHPGPRAMRRMQLKAPTCLTLSSGSRTWRCAIMGNQETTLIIGQDLAAFAGEIRQFRNVLLGAIPVTLLMLVAIGWFLTAQSLRPVKLIAQTAGKITAKGLDQRLPLATAAQEFSELITVFNQMLNRLEKSFQQALRFSADAAHELKTPLTILQAQLERGLQQAEEGSATQREYAELLAEVSRLKAIVRKLLLLAQADAGQLPLHRERVDLSAMLAAMQEDLPALAPQRHLQGAIQPGIHVSGDADLLNQVVQNLVSNAVKFGDPAGTIELTLAMENQQAVLRVANSGHPIPAEDQDKLFNRFHRVEKSRNRAVEGTGLGLSLAREIARAHGGEVILQESTPAGTVFVFTLPHDGR